MLLSWCGVRQTSIKNKLDSVDDIVINLRDHLSTSRVYTTFLSSQSQIAIGEESIGAQIPFFSIRPMRTTRSSVV